MPKKTSPAKTKPLWYQKPLYRSSTDKVFAGLLGGIAEYLGVSSALIRITFVFLTAFSGFFPGIVAYIVGLFIVAAKPAN